MQGRPPRPTPDPRLGRWSRRSLTVPGYLLLGAVALGGLPLWMGSALLVDAVRARGWIATRATAFCAYYFVCESVGLAASLGLWLARGASRASEERYLDWNYRLQWRWAATLLGGGARLFGLRFAVEGEEALRGPPRPLLVFIRHASVADTLLPVVFLSGRHGIRLRYVMKRELLWEPCLDVVGQRLPNAFVRRDSGAAGREIGVVRALAAGLEPGGAVLIYPEGTRSTPEKRERALVRLSRSSNPRLADHARRLRHLLPPRLGGPLALLDACPDADVLMLAHTGLEGLTSFRELWQGRASGREVALRLWRVAAEDLPRSREDRVDWLYTEWGRMDDWIDAVRRPPAVPAPASAAAAGGAG